MSVKNAETADELMQVKVTQQAFRESMLESRLLTREEVNIIEKRALEVAYSNINKYLGTGI